MALNANDLKFFGPLWRRVAITAALAVWCALELILSHDQMWIGITGFGVAYCLYNFFWKWPKTLPGSVALPETTPPIAADAGPSTASSVPAAEPPKEP